MNNSFEITYFEIRMESREKCNIVIFGLSRKLGILGALIGTDL